MAPTSRSHIWPSPITAAQVTAGAARPGEIRGSGEAIWWSESRPSEGGRVQLVRRGADGSNVDVLPGAASARSRVHEYGGGAWDVNGRIVAFADDADDGKVKVFTWTSATPIRPNIISPTAPNDAGPYAERYADLCIDVAGERVFAVRERHLPDGRVVNDVISLPANGSAAGDPDAVVVHAKDADFYGQLALSADGQQLAFIRWMLPDMPWDATELVVLDIGDGLESVIAGGPGESVVEPTWAPDGRLTFCSDRTGWWSPYAWDAARPADPQGVLAPIEAEIGGPMWVFGNRSVAWLDGGRFIAAASADGRDQLVIAAGDGTAPTVLSTPFTHIPQVVAGPDNSVLVVAGGPTDESDVFQVRIDDAGRAISTRLRPSRELTIGPEWFSTPETINVPVGDEGTITHAVIYRPQNPDVSDEEASSLPPLIVLSHGGPTSAARVQLALSVQYFTSRGFCVADVNYRGSTGYGREYREALNGSWGIADVADCAAVASHLADTGVVDPQRLGIRGGSAGGFTTLAALSFTDTFTAGLSAYGIGDLETLARDTHKFESRYLDRLVGPWPEDRATYEARSPIHHLDGLNCPIAVFQGAEDAVVPPAQADEIVGVLNAKGIAYAALTFPNEGHGFRRSENIIRALEAELWFFAHAFDLDLDEDIEAVPGQGL